MGVCEERTTGVILSMARIFQFSVLFLSCCLDLSGSCLKPPEMRRSMVFCSSLILMVVPRPLRGLPFHACFKLFLSMGFLLQPHLCPLFLPGQPIPHSQCRCSEHMNQACKSLSLCYKVLKNNTFICLPFLLTFNIQSCPRNCKGYKLTLFCLGKLSCLFNFMAPD